MRGHRGVWLAGWRYSNESLSSTTPGRPFSRWALLLQLAASHKRRIHLLKPHPHDTFSQHRVTRLFNKSQCPVPCLVGKLGVCIFQSCLYSFLDNKNYISSIKSSAESLSPLKSHSQCSKSFQIISVFLSLRKMCFSSPFFGVFMLSIFFLPKSLKVTDLILPLEKCNRIFEMFLQKSGFNMWQCI